MFTFTASEITAKRHGLFVRDDRAKQTVLTGRDRLRDYRRADGGGQGEQVRADRRIRGAENEPCAVARPGRVEMGTSRGSHDGDSRLQHHGIRRADGVKVVTLFCKVF